jgi:hypothetical protein
MCIKATVGKEGRNDRTDVKIVQILLSANVYCLGQARSLKIDGFWERQRRARWTPFAKRRT